MYILVYSYLNLKIKRFLNLIKSSVTNNVEKNFTEV